MILRIVLLVIAVLLSAGSPKPVKEVKEVKKIERRQHKLGVTGAGQALSRVTAERVDEFWPAIAPDGQTLLFGVVVFDMKALNQKYVWPSSMTPRHFWKDATIAGVDPNTGARRTLYTATTSFSGQPTWLPDGSAFLYASNSPGQFSLVRALSNSPNSAITVIVGGEVAPEVDRPSLSPTGEKVAFGTLIRGTWHLGVSGVDGSRFTLLGEGKYPAWSPQGDRIAFSRMVNDRWQIFLADAETGQNLVQITSGDSHSIQPAWSPDGELLVFSSNRGWNTRKGGSQLHSWNLYVVKTDGTGVTQLTDGTGRTDSPAWGLDGWIYFSSDQAGNFDIWRVQPTGEIAH